MPKDFTWGPAAKKNCRADLRRHGNFVFRATPQVCFWAYIFVAPNDTKHFGFQARRARLMFIFWVL